jgi:hypothetical protein
MLWFIFRRGHVHVAMLLLHAGSDFDIQVYNFVPSHPFKNMLVCLATESFL